MFPSSSSVYFKTGNKKFSEISYLKTPAVFLSYSPFFFRVVWHLPTYLRPNPSFVPSPSSVYYKTGNKKFSEISKLKTFVLFLSYLHYFSGLYIFWFILILTPSLILACSPVLAKYTPKLGITFSEISY